MTVYPSGVINDGTYIHSCKLYLKGGIHKGTFIHLPEHGQKKKIQSLFCNKVLKQLTAQI